MCFDFEAVVLSFVKTSLPPMPSAYSDSDGGRWGHWQSGGWPLSCAVELTLSVLCVETRRETEEVFHTLALPYMRVFLRECETSFLSFPVPTPMHKTFHGMIKTVSSPQVHFN